MIDTTKMTRDEFHAAWEALTQYVENFEDVDESEMKFFPKEQKARVAAARKMMEAMDAQMINLARD